MKIHFLSALVLSCLALTACTETTNQQQETKPIASATQTHDTHHATHTVPNPDWPSFIAATDTSNAPYELRDSNGEVIGFDVDLIQAIAKEEQFNVQVISYPWVNIFHSLESGENHILIAPLTITPERKELVTFTIPYIYPTRTAFLLPETAQRLNINNYNELPKGKISVKDKTTNVTSLETDFGTNNLNLHTTESEYLAFAAMVNKQSDVAFGDTAVLEYHASSIKDINFIKIEQPLKIAVEAGFAVKKGNDVLAEKINNGLKKVINNGEYRRIAVKWFGQSLGNQIASTTENKMKAQ